MQKTIDVEQVLETIVAKDTRYPREAYYFVREALDVAQRKALDITTGGEAVSFKIEIPIVDRIRGAEGEDA